jgi:hypothetical protein
MGGLPRQGRWNWQSHPCGFCVGETFGFLALFIALHKIIQIAALQWIGFKREMDVGAEDRAKKRSHEFCGTPAERLSQKE